MITNELTKQKETHRLRKRTYGCQGEVIVREFGMVMYTLLYLKWITNKDLLYNMELSSVLCGSLDGREVLGRMDTCICMAESLCCSLETIITLFVNRLYPSTK